MNIEGLLARAVGRISREVLLQRRHSEEAVARLVKPIHPPRIVEVRGRDGSTWLVPSLGGIR